MYLVSSFNNNLQVISLKFTIVAQTNAENRGFNLITKYSMLI